MVLEKTDESRLVYSKLMEKTLRIPKVASFWEGDSNEFVRAMDIALMSVGFKLSKDAFEYLAGTAPKFTEWVGMELIYVVRELVGDHIRHNTYFREFPKKVPNTQEFWMECIIEALDSKVAGKIKIQMATGCVNLLDLPKYGTYQHSYTAMLEAHEEFIPSLKDRMTIINLGKDMYEEAVELYYSLAQSQIPLSTEDKKLLESMASYCVNVKQPENIAIRENKAIINKIRIQFGYSLLVDTVTDILRLACVMSDGDVSLKENTKFKSFPRVVRRNMLAALNWIVARQPEKLEDVIKHREQWKRLMHGLHPHESRANVEAARRVMSVATGEEKIKTLAGKIEYAFADGDISKARLLLAENPGMFFRNLDRMVRTTGGDFGLGKELLVTMNEVAGKVSSRVLLSAWQHLKNRMKESPSRIFTNQKGTAWVQEDQREPIDYEFAQELISVCKGELRKRVPKIDHLVVADGESVLGAAVPLSDKNKADGFGVFPRGSTISVDGDILRFFVYWKEKNDRTDFDLSGMVLDENFQNIGHLSWTCLSNVDGVHSGDITSSKNGATEFIDFNLSKVRGKYIIPEVLVFSGESFDEVEENFFGFITIDEDQKGKPFEAAAVQSKSVLKGNGKIALPLIFINEDGKWKAKWLHQYLKGNVKFNKIENNKLSTGLLTRHMTNYDYLTVRELLDQLMLFSDQVEEFDTWDEFSVYADVTFIGVSQPGNVTGRVITLNNIHEIVSLFGE